MAFHNWSDAMAVANARAQVDGRRRRVHRCILDLVWHVS